jgi:uncharacterized protein (TIGR01440 family)
MIEEIRKDLGKALEALYAVSNVGEDAILAVGCSTSEIIGEKIGTAGRDDVAEAVFDTLRKFCKKKKLLLAAQCCEHLNRSLVVEKETMRRFALARVNAVPQKHAGGAFATAAWKDMKEPVLVESIAADLGIDIGDTLIGMHLKPVAVPVRVGVKKIGDAHLVLARTRCKYVGGERAVYDPDLA